MFSGEIVLVFYLDYLWWLDGFVDVVSDKIGFYWYEFVLLVVLYFF